MFGRRKEAMEKRSKFDSAVAAYKSGLMERLESEQVALINAKRRNAADILTERALRRGDGRQVKFARGVAQEASQVSGTDVRDVRSVEEIRLIIGALTEILKNEAKIQEIVKALLNAPKVAGGDDIKN